MIFDDSNLPERCYSFDDEPIISQEEQMIIVDWVLRNNHKFNNSGYSRRMQRLDFFEFKPDVFEILRERIIQKEKLQNYAPEPILDDSIGYMTNGGKLQRHRDPNSGNKIHIRFNVYVQVPIEGGMPIYNDQLIPIPERCYICCRSGIDFHESSEVIGEKARIVISFGFLIPKEEIFRVRYNYLTGFHDFET